MKSSVVRVQEWVKINTGFFPITASIFAVGVLVEKVVVLKSGLFFIAHVICFLLF
jgi:hypothetical protein